jgi:hypothetical protein
MIENGIIVSNKGDLKLYQKVIAIGSTVRDINVGDTVMINPMNYAVMKYDKNSLQNDLDNNKTIKWNLPWVTIDDEKGNPIECLLLNDRDIKFVFEGKETNEKILLADKKPVLLS